MKRCIALASLLAVIAGCGGSSLSTLPDSPLPPPPAHAEDLMEFRHDAWRLTLPLSWVTDDTAKVILEKDHIVRVLESWSPNKMGRAPANVVLYTLPWDGSSKTFAAGVIKHGTTLFPHTRLVSTQDVTVDVVEASLSVLTSVHGYGLALVGVADGKTGYLLTCGGDITLANAEVEKACTDVLRSFHVR